MKVATNIEPNSNGFYGLNNVVTAINTADLAQSKVEVEKPIDVNEVVKAVDKLNKSLSSDNTEAIFERHKFFGDTMVKIINKETKEVLLEIPPKKILDVVAKMCELVGVGINKKA